MTAALSTRPGTPTTTTESKTSELTGNLAPSERGNTLESGRPNLRGPVGGPNTAMFSLLDQSQQDPLKELNKLGKETKGTEVGATIKEATGAVKELDTILDAMKGGNGNLLSAIGKMSFGNAAATIANAFSRVISSPKVTLDNNAQGKVLTEATLRLQTFKKQIGTLDKMIAEEKDGTKKAELQTLRDGAEKALDGKLKELKPLLEEYKKGDGQLSVAGEGKALALLGSLRSSQDYGPYSDAQGAEVKPDSLISQDKQKDLQKQLDKFCFDKFAGRKDLKEGTKGWLKTAKEESEKISALPEGLEKETRILKLWGEFKEQQSLYN